MIYTYIYLHVCNGVFVCARTHGQACVDSICWRRVVDFFFLLAINKHRDRETETHFFIRGLTPRKILSFFFSHFPLSFFEKTSLSPRSFQVGHAIDKELLSTINKILIDNLSIRIFCY
jgi:hypothetical protein